MVKKEIVIITPVYEDVEAASRLFEEIAKDYREKATIVAVDDASVKQPVSLNILNHAGLSGVILKLKRNVGHQQAIAIGISFAAQSLSDNDYFIVMDSDGEDMPSTIEAILEPLERDDIDIVVAKRKSRHETLRFKLFYIFYRVIFRLFTGRKISFGNFMAMKEISIKRLASMKEIWTHVAASILQSRLRIFTQPLDRGPRYAGKSKMNFVSLALHGFKALMVFAEDVLVRVGIGTAFLAFFSIIGGIAAIVLKISGYATPGWFSTAVGILLVVFLQTGALTLLSLMLTGTAKGGALPERDYSDYILEVLKANGKEHKRKRI